MSELEERMSEGYQDYLQINLGEKVAKKAFAFHRFHYFREACTAAFKMRDYDYGIALAKSGMWLGYIFSVFGFFPILTVWTKRMGFGASWRPFDLLENLLPDKRILVFENDVVTGRTLKRTVRELQALNPQFIDLLLVYDHTEISYANYEKWRPFLTKEVRVIGNHFGNICLNTMCMVPKGFRKVMSLEKNVTFSPDALKFLEREVPVTTVERRQG